MKTPAFIAKAKDFWAQTMVPLAKVGEHLARGFSRIVDMVDRAGAAMRDIPVVGVAAQVALDTPYYQELRSVTKIANSVLDVTDTLGITHSKE